MQNKEIPKNGFDAWLKEHNLVVRICDGAITLCDGNCEKCEEENEDGN